MSGGEESGRMSTSELRRAWGRLLAYMGRYRREFYFAVACSFVGTMISLAGPNILSDITDTIQEGLGGSMDLDRVTGLCVLLIVLYLISWALNAVQGWIMATVSQRTASQMRRDISSKMNRMPLRYFDTHPVGDTMSRVTNDADAVGGNLDESLGTVISSATLFIGAGIMMVWTNVWMAAAAIATSLAGFAVVSVVMSRSQKHFKRQQDDLGAMNGFVEETYSGHDVVKAFSDEEEKERGFDAINDDLFRSGFRSQFLGGLMMPFMSAVGNLGYVVVCIVGAWMCIEHGMGFGTIVAFMVYVRLFTQPLSEMAQALVLMQTVGAASERVFAFLDEEEMEDESDKPSRRPEHVEGRVEFRDIRFGYTKDREIIHGFSATVEPGQKIAIVGPTGAGKTTLVNLLMRFYEVDSGEILIDGIPIREMRREDVRSMFCMVLQDTWLFEGTLRENLVFNGEDVPDSRLDEVCREVGLDHFVRTLPKRYDTVITGGSALSAGQRQEATIARAMIEDAPMLILDEATSSVDTRTERTIQAAMDSLTRGRTSFVIAHRLSTIRNADLILVLKDGNIVEQGTHEELLARNGFYADLYNSQFEPA